MGRIPQVDRNWEYSDMGCYLHPSCLSCPRLVCIYDERSNKPRDRRNLAIREQYSQSKDVKGIADAFGLSRRTVQRIVTKKT